MRRCRYQVEQTADTADSQHVMWQKAAAVHRLPLEMTAQHVYIDDGWSPLQLKSVHITQ